MYSEIRIKKLSILNKKKLLKGLPIKISLGDGDCIILTKTQHKSLSSKGSMEISCSVSHCKKLHNFYNKDLIGGGVGGYGSIQGRKIAPEPVPQPISEAERTRIFLEEHNDRVMNTRDVDSERRTPSELERDEQYIKEIHEHMQKERRKMLGGIQITPEYKREPVMDYKAEAEKKREQEEARHRRILLEREKKERKAMALNDKYDFRENNKSKKFRKKNKSILI
jgi:hypothetical protein